ncbi:uncharacterized protein LOC133316657 [Gastrolobium bilobum]|uniref:uncharacterized protein LOC133316657 n=1 Tax=Gastrolobium bilobum TaxID=150636 RepID=UPI002AAF8686|nr:uncharacterized protein LOC133316657 [Gastrolobium bilobum]
MESKHQRPSVILELMGLDKVPPQHPVRAKQKVLSENYLQKVASIGVRKKRSSDQHHSLEMSTDDMEESEDVLKVVKALRRDKHHNPSKENGKEIPYLSGAKVKGVPQQLLDASVNWKPESLVDTTSSFNFETSVNSWRIAEKGNLRLRQKTNDGLQKDMNGEAGLYETSSLSKSQLDLKDETFTSRVSLLKPNPGKGRNGLKYFSLPSACKNSRLADGPLKEIFCPRSIKVYPEMRGRKKISYHMNFGKKNSRSFSKISEEVSTQTGNVANRVLESSFFRGNEAFVKSSDMLKPVSNITVNEIPQKSQFFCSDGSYVGFEAMNKTLEQRDVTEKLLEVGQHGHGSTHHQSPMISEHGNRARNLSYLNGFGNDKIKRNNRCKVGVSYSFARKVQMARPLSAASVIGNNCGTMTKDDLFQKYWGVRKNASANWSIRKPKNQSINQKYCSEDVNLRSSHEKSSSFSSYFNSNHTEENYIDLSKLKKRCNGNDLSDKKPMLPQLSRSGPSHSQILQETCLMNNDVKNNMHEDSTMLLQNVVSPDLSIDCLVSDAKTEVVGWSHNNPTMQQSESTASVVSHADSDSLSHTSHVSTQQDTSEFQEHSVYSLCFGAGPDSLVSFEPSPISVLDPSFREGISFSSECGSGVYDSSEVDDEGFGLNVSSDEDCGNESVVGDIEKKKEIVGLFGAEESRDFSYVVEVLTEAGISNRSLFTDFSTWHSAECPISPSVFEILEKKFGGAQQLWKRSERRLLFDRINLGLLEIFQPYLYIPLWEKPVSRRLSAEPSQDLIEEEMWGLLVSQEKKASKENENNMLGGEIRWIELADDVEDIVREIVILLIEELANEIV